MGSGFESQGAHFKENPADSSESAGFLRSLVNTVLRCEVHIILFALGFDARKTVFALVPTGVGWVPRVFQDYGVRYMFPPRLRRGTRHPDAPLFPCFAAESVRVTP